ncbi:hypothetical protein ABE480_11000 [Elizabethkingia anophelis]|uniref:hypothetical protein n=2 Tax=Elizabethkingia anophelis TaxID=1117645 RepID=UPI003208FF63
MMNKKSKKQKKKYEVPKIEVVLVKMEQGIAAGSARVSPLDTANGTVKDEWDTEDQSGTIEW